MSVDDRGWEALSVDDLDSIAVDDDLAAELCERLGRLGYDGPLGEAFESWAGAENLEERVAGVQRIDPVVLEELRKR